MKVSETREAVCPRCQYRMTLKGKQEPPRKCPACNDVEGGPYRKCCNPLKPIAWAVADETSKP